MTSFVHVDMPTEHPGVARAARAADSLKQVASTMMSARGAASLLLAAIVSALLVVANQVIETWTEGHLMLAWVVLWTIGFAALALAAGPIRSAVNRARLSIRRWAVARHAAAQDVGLWRVGLTDSRVMADLSRGMSEQAPRDMLVVPRASASRYEWGRGL